MAYTTIDNPELYFQTVLYTGNATARSITLDGSENMQPDWVWCKNRDISANNHLFDSVRGATKDLIANTTTSEATDAQKVTSFDTDGFSLGTNGNVNGNTNNQVAWCWKAGTSFSNDASATSVGTLDSTGSINTTHGFSIISYTGNATSGATVAHGLGAAPGMILIKNRSAGSTNWNLFHKSLTGNTALFPDLVNAADTNSKYFNDTNPTSTVFTLGNYNDANGNGNNIIAYCFAEKQGYSKFGKYTGNGNADGTFVYTGFRPAFLLTKDSSASRDWAIIDNKRDTHNIIGKRLFPNNSDAENTESNVVDFTANGFKIRNTTSSHNVDGNTYIYWAFAESPFVNSNGVPTNAR